MHVLRALASSLAAISAVGALNSTGLTTTVQWDPTSLLLFGQRTFILSAELHPWRLPNPNLWRDILEKVKDNGFNTISFYSHWGLHFPSEGVNGDEGLFESGGWRDLQRWLDECKRAGLWVIARPGPYVNGETTGGGIPGWASSFSGALRTNAADYESAWKPYITAMAKLVAANQISNGGPIILVQAENEFSQAATHNAYMQAIEDTYRAEGVVIPFTHNDQHSGAAGNFSPDTDTTPGQGAVNIYCGDSYPQGTSSWSPVQTIYRSAHVGVAPSNPLCLAEFGGGFLLNWGSSPTSVGGTGYEKYTNTQDNAAYENVFYKDAYAQTATIFNIYMTFGGTNWGNTAEPTVYSSYDYGGGINENRVLTPKMAEMRLQGLFLRVSRGLLTSAYVGNGTNYTTDATLFTQELRNDEGAAFYFVRHADSTSQVVTTSQLSINTSQGDLTIPKNGSMTIQGREHKIIVVDYVFGDSNEGHLLYSTSEVMTWTTLGNTTYIVLYAMAGQSGETVFIFESISTVSFFGTTNFRSIFKDGTLTLNYVLSGTSFVHINSDLVVILLEKEVATTWHAPLLPGATADFGSFFGVGSNTSVLVSGPYLIREAEVNGSTLVLTGDLNGTTSIEFVPLAGVDSLNWNGEIQTVKTTKYGTFKASLAGLNTDVVLPSLGPWKVMGALPEIDPSFDDSSFVTADQTTTNYTALPPLTPGPILYSQQYGFFGGIQLYRGHFNASGDETGLNLTVQGGFGFAYSVFLNGAFLGSGEGNSTVSLTNDVWNFAAENVKLGEDNVVLVIMDHMGLVETSTNSGKEPRGIRGVALVGSNTTFSSWKIQGNLGGNTDYPDTVRGYLNEGGLYPVRIGAHLPGFDDSAWTDTTELSVAGVGINFFRTTFSINLPNGNLSDVPIRLAFTPGASSSRYRAQIYINGWQFGEYINNLGPQTIFVLPSGILRRSTPNTVALSLWSLTTSGATASVSLISDGVFSSSQDFSDWNLADDFGAQVGTREEEIVVEPM